MSALIRLSARNTLLRTLRGFLHAHGFLEADTPQLVPGPGLEPHIDPLAVPVKVHVDAAAHERFLITSPELALKRLLVELLDGGTPPEHARVYQISHVFRDGERTSRHTPEFMLLEWYQVGLSLGEMMAQTAALIGACADALAVTPPCDVRAPFDHSTVQELFARHAGIDLRACIAATDAGDGDALPRAARAAGLMLRPGATFDDAFVQVMGDCVEPRIGHVRPAIVSRWPASMAVLARRCTDDALFAERFEIYAAGLELCNAFHELTDPAEQRTRFAADNAVRAALGKRTLPVDEEFLGALGRLPPTSGNALGVDRLLMLLCGATQIDDVVAQRWR